MEKYLIKALHVIQSRTKLWIRKSIIIPIMRKRLQNKDLTLISPNCVGGVVLHELGLRFHTPTINLYIDGLGYFTFLEHLGYYLSTDVVPCTGEKLQAVDAEYPILVLKGQGSIPDIPLYCVHYGTYAEAVEAWQRRKTRVRFDNLFVIAIAGGEWWARSNQTELMNRFENLPFENKVFFVNQPVDQTCFPHVHYIKGYESSQYLGQLLDYTGPFGRRFYDQFDFVSWFNNHLKKGE